MISNRVDYLPMVDRPIIRWPNGERVAFWVSPNVEHYEYLPEYDGIRDPWPRMPYPDAREYAYCDYGNRVGFWRMLESLDRHNIKCTVSLNMAVLEHYPEITKAMVDRDWDFMSHGIYNTRYLNNYSEKQERAFYEDNISTLRKYTGKTLKGMLGPAISGSYRTPDLMAEAGLIYHTDWMHDDQPVPINVSQGKLISVPYSVETNDGVIFRRHADNEYFVKVCKSQFDQLYKEGEKSGRVMCLAIHPFLVGQPHRIKALEKVLEYIMAHDGVWQTTADEIADYYMANYYDKFKNHAMNIIGGI